jgi:ribosomal protein S26
VFTTKGKGLDLLGRIFSSRGMGSRGVGGSSLCRCPNCGYTMPHKKGVPCSAIECPRCSTPMKGENC